METLLGFALTYAPGVQKAINTRALAVPHFLIPGVTFALMIFFYDEARKFFVVRGIRRERRPGGTMLYYDGWIARTTCY